MSKLKTPFALFLQVLLLRCAVKFRVASHCLPLWVVTTPGTLKNIIFEKMEAGKQYKL